MALLDALVPLLRQKFPDREFRVEHGKRPCVVFPAAHQDVGDFAIVDDEVELTVYAGNFTHGHFEAQEPDRTEAARTDRIVTNVISFLEALFADEVVIWGSNQSSGGWMRIDDPLDPSIRQQLDEMRNDDLPLYVWSGPCGRRSPTSNTHHQEHLMTSITPMLLAAALTVAQPRAQRSDAPALQPTDTAYHEPLRPLVHFTAKKNWLNDPNGLVYFDGEYHLFFQHNPNGIEWGDMTWGHAVSRNLVQWTQLDNAIVPDALGTIYSGSAAVDWNNTSGFGKDGKPPLVAMYTAAGGKSEASKGQPFTQCVAFSNDKGRTWTKFDGNPVIPHIAAENRDPKIIWHGPTRKWIVVLYEDGSRYSLHASPDLKHWTKLQDLEVPGCSECPDFFPIALQEDPSSVMWVFTAADARYLLGSFDGTKFTPEGGLQQLDFGRNFYAVQSYSDLAPVPAASPNPTGVPSRRVQIGWMRGPRLKDMPFNQQMSFPTELKLRRTSEGPRLFRTPVAEIIYLHDHTGTVRGTCAKPGVDDGWLAGIKGEALHIAAQFQLGTATEVGLVIRGEPIRYTVADKTLHALGDARLDFDGGSNSLKLELIVDRTSIETFGMDGRVAMASCFEPKPGSPPVSILITGEGATATLVITPLKSAWERHK